MAEVPSIEEMVCPMCGGDVFDEVVVDGPRWVYLKGLYKGVMGLFKGAVSQRTQSYRCRRCENIQTFARKE